MLRKMSTFLVIFFVIKLCALSRLFDFIRGKYGHEALHLLNGGKKGLQVGEAQM